MLKKYFFVFAMLIAAGVISAQTRLIPFNDPSLTYEGRILYRSDAAELTWPGTSVSLRFQGKNLSVVLQDLDTANYYNIVVDGKVTGNFHTDMKKHSYVLASGIPAGEHVVQLFKRTEWDKGKTLFYGFETDAKVLPAPAPQKRKMEFFGNSITCGYAMEDYSGKDSWFGYFENNYLSYAALTARHFDAQYVCTSKSGIGIMVSWFPMIMPEMYNRLDPNDSTSRWDFTKYTPDIVVINLFQNDSWLVKNHNHPEFKHRFGTTEPDENTIISAYRNFVSTIRKTYPKAYIICALGNMDATREGSLWPGYIQKAVAQLNDSKVYTHFFPYKNTPGHPKVSEQQDMANSLIDFIDKNIKW